MTEPARNLSQDPADLLRAAVTGAAPLKDSPASKTKAAPPVPAPPGDAARGLARLVPLRRPAAVGAGLLLVAGLGYGAARFAPPADAQAALRWSETAAGLRQNHDDVTHMMAELRTLRLAVDGMKGDRTRLDLTGKQAQLNDRLDRTTSESAARIGKLAEQIERMEKTQRDPARIQSLVDRLDRIEKQTQTVAEKVTAPAPAAKPVPVAAAPVDTVTQTGSLAEVKSKGPDLKGAELDPRKIPLEGYVLRDVDDGVALVEARNGRMIEVQPGRTLSPGNRVEAIERRGKQWIVVTAKGFIGERWP